MGWLNKPFTTFNEKSPLANNASKAFARNYEDLVSHPVSSSTGGLIGGDSGVIDFSNAVNGAGVENNSLTGGLSNKNNKYGLIALATYLSGGSLSGGEAGGAAGGAASSGGGSGAASGGSAGGGWQQYMKMGSGMGGGMGGGQGGQGSSSSMDESQRLQQETSDYMEKRRQEEEAKRLEEEKARLLAQAVRGGYGY